MVVEELLVLEYPKAATFVTIAGVPPIPLLEILLETALAALAPVPMELVSTFAPTAMDPTLTEKIINDLLQIASF